MLPDEHQIRLRVGQDVILEGLAVTWERRADLFDWAAPKSSDFHGRASSDQLRDRHSRCTATARACRNKAAVIRRG